MTAPTRVVFVSCPPDRAADLARRVVESGVAACVNVLPSMQSTYRWQGAVHCDTESLLIIKTSEDRFDALRETVLAAHPYELPEIIAVPITEGHAPYLDWIVASTRP